MNNWQQAFAATTAISLIPNILLFFIPTNVLTATRKLNNGGIVWQHVLLSFAAGGLLGDVVLHTIPHLMMPHDHSTHSEHEEHGNLDAFAHGPGSEEALYGHGSAHDHHKHKHHHHTHHHNDDPHSRMLFVGVTVMLGFLFFFLVEKFAALHMATPASKKADPVLAVAKEIKGGAVGTVAATARKTPARGGATTRRRSGSRATTDDEREGDGAPTRARSGSKTRPPTRSAQSPAHVHTHVDVSSGGFWAALSRLSATGWLNLLADGLHNFTDGAPLARLEMPHHPCVGSHPGTPTPSQVSRLAPPSVRATARRPLASQRC